MLQYIYALPLRDIVLMILAGVTVWPGLGKKYVSKRL